MTDIEDNRKKIYNNTGSTYRGINNISDITDSDLKMSFDIERFKVKLNDFLDTLSIHLKFEIDEVFKHYTLQETLSKTILVIITHALYKVKYKEHTLIKLDGSTITNAEIERFKMKLWNTNKDNLEPIIYSPSDDAVYKAFKDLNGGKLFALYNHLVSIENNNHETLYLNRIKLLSNEVNKYFFLSEILLKMLLDTKHNVDASSPDNKEIVRNFYGYTSEKGMSKPVDIPENKCRSSNLNPLYIETNMKTKLLKNIYDTVVKLNSNSSSEISVSLQYFTNATSNNDKNENTINELNENKNVDHNKITTLLKKQKEIEHNNKWSLLKTIIMFIVLLTLIGANIYVSTKNNPNKLLQVNVIIILVIFTMKFYYLFK